MIESNLLAGKKTLTGEAVFLTTGSHSWTIPDGVESISVVAIGSRGQWR